MRAQALAHEVTIDRVDLQALDEFLMSERSPPDSMALSELDGFITGIAIGPALIRPSEWLPLVWGGAAPKFAGLDDANAILGSLMARYNEILRQIGDDAFAPILWADDKGTVSAMDWAEGFLQAIMLRADEWVPLFNSRRDDKLLFPILALCCDENGNSLLGLPPEPEGRILALAPELIPGCITGIANYWRRKEPRQISTWLKSSTAAAKVGRNDPCPCGSGKKFKRCCGETS